MAVRDDVRVILDRDPAAKSVLEVLLTYPGLHALLLHRCASQLHRRGVPLLPRLISHVSRMLTGVEIHPAARIGRGVFIDHGMGVVIGETAEIGDDVTLYQGVTLGGTGKERGKRHPTVGRGVVLGVGAKVLGAITIGEGAKIGAGAVVLHDVPPHTTAVGVPARPVVVRQPEGMSARVGALLDPEGWPPSVAGLRCRLEELENRIAALELEAAAPTPGGPARRHVVDLRDHQPLTSPTRLNGGRPEPTTGPQRDQSAAS